jgi:GH24 family phage-related lysozyme (muramidase)
MREDILMRQSVRDAFFDFTTPLEGIVKWMYLDVKGLVTVGVGNLLPDEGSAAALPFFRDGSPSSLVDDATKRQGWRDVKARQDLKLKLYTSFEPVCNLRLSTDNVRDLVNSKLSSNKTILLGFFPDFPNWPADAQLGLMSMAWALGAAFSPHWPNFTAACRSRDFAAAAINCRISETGNPGLIPRNKANQLLFQNASKVENPENGYDLNTLYYPVQLLDAVIVEGTP